MDRYINPFIDYGFKKLFATEANKDLLISFLNAIIEDKNDPIVDLQYKNVEQIGEFNGTRTNYFDVYCETRTGRQFIVEMQNSWKPFFKDRTIYYAAKPIRDQGLREVAESDRRKRKKVKNNEEKQDWDYRLNEVYLVAIMNFTFPKSEYKADDYFHTVMLADVDDHHVFYDKLTLYYIEMPKLDKVELDLKKPRDRWLYAFYHLWRYDDYPEELEDDIFRKFYEQAEYAHFTPNQQLTYERSKKVYLDTINEIRGGRILGKEEGLAEGFEKGLVEGASRSKIEIAKRMKELGFEKATILKAVDITEEELDNI